MPITLHGIATRPVNKAPMESFESGRIMRTGLRGNFCANVEKQFTQGRQVTVISLEQWQQAMIKIDQNLIWHTRRANLCIEGHLFTQMDVGRSLLIGRSALLEITGETEPCKRMDEIFPGLQEALRVPFRGGVTCRVTNHGDIYIDDVIHII